MNDRLEDIDEFRRGRKPQFSPKEDAKLVKIVQQYGPFNWHMIGKKMKTRTGRQCRDRYQNYLRPGCNKGPWTEEEYELLKQKVMELGPKWTEISTFFNGRTGINIKNRWNYYCRNIEKIQNDYEVVCPNNSKMNCNEIIQHEIVDEKPEEPIIPDFIQATIVEPEMHTRQPEFVFIHI